MEKKAEITAPLRQGQKSLKQPKGGREGGSFSRASLRCVAQSTPSFSIFGLWYYERINWYCFKVSTLSQLVITDIRIDYESQTFLYRSRE